MDHKLKTIPAHFEAIRNGSRRFDIRFNDRNFQQGDTLILTEFVPCPTCNGRGKVISLGREVGGGLRTELPCACLDTSTPRGTFTGRSFEVQVLYVQDLHLHGNRHVASRVVMSLSFPALPLSEQVAAEFAERNDLDPEHARLLINEVCTLMSNVAHPKYE